MKVANRSMGHAQVRVNMPSQRGVLWACVLVIAVCGGLWGTSPRAMTQVSAYAQSEIDAFFAKYGIDMKKTHDKGKTLLHIALEEERVNVVRFLIEKGADVNAKDEYGWTPLHIAASKENPEVIKLLIEKGAGVNARTTGKPWSYRYGPGETPLHRAAEYNKNPEVIKLLIEKGADVNAKDESGYTPLRIAVQDNKNPGVIKPLLENGADWKAIGWSPLCVAVVNENLHDVQKLLNEGAEVSDRDRGRRTPLHFAAMNKGGGIIKLLIEKRADVNSKTPSGWTPLHIAAEYNKNPEVIKLLIEKGADVNAKDESGYTPLHNLVFDISSDYIVNRNLYIIRLFIAHGADVNAKSNPGQTPRDVAKDARYVAALTATPSSLPSEEAERGTRDSITQAYETLRASETPEQRREREQDAAKWELQEKTRELDAKLNGRTYIRGVNPYKY